MMSRYCWLVLFCWGVLLADGTPHGCEVDVAGTKVKVKPSDAPGPAQPKVIGHVVIDGRQFELIDVNADGIADFVRDTQTGQWYQIVGGATHPLPVPNPGPGIHPYPYPPSYDPSNPRIRAAGGNGQAAATAEPDFSFGGEDYFIAWSGVEPEWHPEWPGATAAQTISQLGLNIPPGGTISAQILDIALNTETQVGQVSLWWSTAFSMPDQADYPSLGYEFHSQTAEEGPWALHLRVQGQMSEIVNWLLEFSDDGTFSTEFEVEGTQWRFEAIEAAGMAYLERNGELFAEYRLED